MSEEYKHETFGYTLPGLPEETVKMLQEQMEKAKKDMLEWKLRREARQPANKDTTWVEREVPEYLEDAAHDLITALLKSHGYKWDGEKQDD